MYQYEHQNIVNVISQIERNFPVHTLTFQNVKIWPLLKVDFNFQMIYNESLRTIKKNDNNSPIAEKNLKQKVGDILASYKNYQLARKELKLIEKTRVKSRFEKKEIPYVFLSFSTFRSHMINGKYFNSQLDPFISTMKNPENLLAIEFTLVNNNKLPMRTEVFNIDHLRTRTELRQKKNTLKQYIKEFLGLKSQRHFIKNEQEIISFLQRNSITNITFDSETYIYQMQSILAMKEEFIEVYQKLSPKFVICPCYFNHESFASTLACHELGIQTIEMQHGIYGQQVYRYEGILPKDGYEMLPNYFFSWDTSQAELINNWAKETSKHKALEYGLNALSFWAKNKESFENKHLINLKELLSQKEKIKILFTISDSIDEKLPQLIKNTEESCFWFIRNHPRAANAEFILEFIKTMQELNCANYEIENSTHAPLYSLLWEMDYHVTMISSVICEALQINLPSVVINESGKQLFHDFYQNNPLILFSTNSDEILNFITTEPSMKKEFKIAQNQNFENFTSNL
jgi:hypothetical protein